ncbi:hypothetical protein QQ054_19580 [Oscillatoria amoena NRMC-F 0135]|nr:hypothetical protein [Oscillatoria laete-virens]MDL5048216.1 hypothetical protein [Oscillatoria amoena NRMC-F 0135]
MTPTSGKTQRQNSPALFENFALARIFSNGAFMKKHTAAFVLLMLSQLANANLIQSERFTYAEFISTNWYVGNKLELISLAVVRLQNNPDDLGSQLILFSYVAGSGDIKVFDLLSGPLINTTTNLTDQNFLSARISDKHPTYQEMLLYDYDTIKNLSITLDEDAVQKEKHKVWFKKKSFIYETPLKLLDKNFPRFTADELNRSADHLKYLTTNNVSDFIVTNLIRIYSTNQPAETPPHPPSAAESDVTEEIHGLSKRNWMSVLMIAGGSALVVMILLYAFWPRGK